MLNFPFLQQLKSVLKSIFSVPFWSLLFQIYVIGVGTALTAILLRNGMRGLSQVRLDLLGTLPPWIVLPLMGFGGGAIAGTLVQWVDAGAAGSGFPQLIQFFKDASVRLTWRTAITKLLGGIVVIGAGFPLGVEGPSAHMGASIAAQLSQCFSVSPDRRRLLIATGSGAGIAAAFNAPLGGFAYVIESLIKDIAPGVTIAIAIGTMTADFWGQVFGYQGLHLLAGSNFAILYQFEVSNASYAAIDIPFLVILGILAGLLATLFDRCILWLQSLIWHQWGLQPVVAIATTGLLIGIIYAFLPHNFRDSATLQSALVAGKLSWPIAAVGLITTLVLTILAAASKAPGGLFSSMLTVGGALGLLVNALAHQWIAYNPPTLVIAGMGAFMSALTVSPCLKAGDSWTVRL